MREITFRGKTYDGMWIEGAYYHANKNYGDPDDVHCIIPTTESLDYEQALEYFIVDPSTVGQYTGLKDKNGKRIFEGDVLEYNDGYDYFKGKVVFELGAFGIGNSEVCQAFIGNCDNFASLWDIYWEQEPIDAPELYYCTILGNIYDNPELLEVR